MSFDIDSFINWELWKIVSHNQLCEIMDYDNKTSNKKYLDTMSEEAVFKHILKQIKIAEQQAAFVTIQDAETRLKEFTREVLRG